MAKQKKGGNKKSSSASAKARRQRNADRRPLRTIKTLLWHNGVAAAEAFAKPIVGGPAALRRLAAALPERRVATRLAAKAAGLLS